MTFYLQTYPYRRMARRWAHLPSYGSPALAGGARVSRTVPGENRDQTLSINVREEDEAYILSALVPGIKSDELNIQVLEDVLRIEGEYQRSSPVDQRSSPVDQRSGPVDKADENKYLVRELPNGSFTRTLRLPAPIDAEHVEADITDGILTLKLPKAESARPKQIKIQSK